MVQPVERLRRIARRQAALSARLATLKARQQAIAARGAGSDVRLAQRHQREAANALDAARGWQELSAANLRRATIDSANAHDRAAGVLETRVAAGYGDVAAAGREAAAHRAGAAADRRLARQEHDD